MHGQQISFGHLNQGPVSGIICALVFGQSETIRRFEEASALKLDDWIGLLSA
jgi:hypothetical protein